MTSRKARSSVCFCDYVLIVCGTCTCNNYNNIIHTDQNYALQLYNTLYCKMSNVGIKAIQCYIPKAAVSQKEMETLHGCDGKYTKGLGQVAMSLVDDREDIHSSCLSALDMLFSSTSISPNDVGRLEVGTETLMDTSICSHGLLFERL